MLHRCHVPARAAECCGELEKTMNNHKPYVGVAGFMQTSEIMAAIATMPKNPRHNLAIGILASAKTLNGQTNKYPNRYPKIADIAEMVRPTREFVEAKKLPVEFILHYAVEPEESFCFQFERVRDVVNEAQLDGIQVNVSPDYAANGSLDMAIAAAKRSSPGMKRVIMQLRPPRDNEHFVDLIQAGIDIGASDTATNILIDASAGHGVSLNGHTANVMIQGIRGSAVNRHRVGIGVAGGLRPGGLALLHGLMEVHGPLSFDVETGVRDQLDSMSIPAMQTYLSEAWEIVGSDG
jgi:hypothetical protein